MVPCYICQKPAEPGWICGPPPAAERYKLGLCKLHDTPANRETVLAAWEARIKEELDSSLRQDALEGLPLTWYDVKVLFVDGGQTTIACTSYEIDKEQDSLICHADGAMEFIPMQHVRRFQVFPRQEDKAHPNARPPSSALPA